MRIWMRLCKVVMACFGLFVDAGVAPVPGNGAGGADVALVKLAPAGPVGVGEVFTYTLRVWNRGPERAEVVSILDPLPAGVALESVDLAGGKVASVDPLEVVFGGLDVGEEKLVEVRVRVLPGTAGTLVNVADVWTATPDPDLGNNWSEVNTPVKDTQAPDLTCPQPMVVSVPVGQCSAVVTFTVEATDDQGGVTVVSTPPSGSAFPIGETTVTSVATDGTGNTSTCQFTVTVTDPGNVAWPLALPIPLMNLLGVQEGAVEQCLTQLDESRWYRFRVEPGSRVVVTLTGLAANYDLVLFRDIGAAYEELVSPQDLERINAEFAADAFSPAAFSPAAFSPAAFSPAAFSPAAFSPAAFSPDVFSPAAFSPAAFSPAAFSPDAYAPAAFSPAAFSPAAFSPAAFSPAAFSPAAFSPAAFSAAQLRSVIAVSAFEGTASEGVVAHTWDLTGDFYVRVRGRDGVFSPGQPFHLGVYLFTGVCGGVSPVPVDQAGQALPPSTFAAPAGGYRTLLVTDFSRLTGPMPSADRLALEARLGQLASRSEVAGVILDVGEDPWVEALNAQADARYDCPAAKNLVAEAIRAAIQRSRAVNPIEYVVLLGNDEVVPFFRYPDQALLGPERDYVPPVEELTASSASLRNNYVLGQDAYGATCVVPLKVSTLPIPELAVGRLVESADDMVAFIDRYLKTAAGVVPTPQDGLVTGYDFLEDVAEAVKAEFELGLGKAPESLIAPRDEPPSSALSWTADQLRTVLLAKRHDLIFLAGHFSASAALAADYRTAFYADELAASPVDLEHAILFSAGCHSGYNIVDAHAQGLLTREPDWPEACLQKGMTLIAGTGYQYGDTDFIEYSERLYLEFARELRTGVGPVSVGQALVRAKQTYLADTPAMRGIHEKSFHEATLFGLPMLRMELPGTRRTRPVDASVIGATTGFGTDPGLTLGLRSAELVVVPTLTEQRVTLDIPDLGTSAEASYYRGAQGVLVNPTEPVLPLEVRNVTVPGVVLRGVGFREGTYVDEPDVLPLTGAATTEIRGVHVAFGTDVLFPPRPWGVNYFDRLCSGAQGTTRLQVTPAQFVSQPLGTAKGVWRRFDRMDFRLFYSAEIGVYTSPGSGVDSVPGLAAPPSITGVRAVTVGADVRFSVRVTGNPAAGIQQVWVTYTGLTGPWYGEWRSLDLVQSNVDSTLWEALLPLGTMSPSDVRYMVQAVNGVGLVSLEMGLGGYRRPDEGDPGQLQATELTWVESPASAATGTQTGFSARLTSAGSPVRGEPLLLQVGDQQVWGVTRDDGLAAFVMNLLGLPGVYEAKVVYAGDGQYAPSFVVAGLALTRQATQLQLVVAGPSTSQPAQVRAEAVLTGATGSPLLERTVLFTFQGPGPGQGQAQVAITDPNGRAWVTFPAPGDGGATVGVFFGGTVNLPDGSVLDLEDGRYEASSAVASVVLDGVAPTLSILGVNPPVLWPPNHQWMNVRVLVRAVDNLGPVRCRIVEITSNEPVNGLGDGDTAPDWEITGDLTARLRAERAQNGSGRIYTLALECTDAAGNAVYGKATVQVPKDPRRR